MTVEARKYQLINQITRIENDAVLKILEDTLAKVAAEQDSVIFKLAKPMRKQMLIEDLIKEQNYAGPNKESLEKIIDEIDIEESIEELLKMI